MSSEMEISAEALSISNDEPDPACKTEELEGEDASSQPEAQPQTEDTASTMDDDSTVDSDDDDNASSKSTDSLTTLVSKSLTFKETGNNHFKENNLSKAAQSYRKAISALRPLQSSSDPQVKSLLLTLNSNLSMVRFKQKNFKQSRDLATAALKVDGDHVKALYRRAAACRKMGEMDICKNDLKKALKIDPENREIRREWISLKKDIELLEKKERKGKEALKKAMSKGGSFLYEDKEKELKKKAEQKKLKAEEAKLKESLLKKQWEDECVQKLSMNETVGSFEDWRKELKKKNEEQEKLKKKEEERIKEEKAEARRKQREQNKKDDSSDDEPGTELSKEEQKMLRGYKTTSDGRTTSYFNREISEEEKQLIGNITPQRLVQPKSPADASTSSSSTPTESAWNAAQTWEERNTTEWCTTSLKKRLLDTTALSSHYAATMTDVSSISGDASFALAGGKRRYIFDYTAELQFSVTAEGQETDVAAGTLKLVDVCSGTVNDGDYGIEFSWTTAPKGDITKAVTLFCKSDLFEAVKMSVQGFVNDFTAQY